MMNLLFIENFGGGFLLFSLIGLVMIALWIYALVDVIRSDFKDANMKLIWILILVFTQVLGAIVYLIIGKNGKVKAA